MTTAGLHVMLACEELNMYIAKHTVNNICHIAADGTEHILNRKPVPGEAMLLRYTPEQDSQINAVKYGESHIYRRIQLQPEDVPER